MFSGVRALFHRKKSESKGYTLIEVVVAVAIFTTMLMLGSIALNQTLMQYKALAKKGFSFWQYAKVVWIDKSIGSMTDYYVMERQRGWFPYFKGDLNGFSYVSLSPFAGDSPSVVWVIKEKNEKGKYDLKYYELPVVTKKYEDIEDDFVFGNYKKGNSYIIFNDVQSINFQYYGFDISKRTYEWFNEFEGKLKKTLPVAIMIDYKDDEGDKKLLLKVNTNSLMKLIYNEIYKQ
jgi:general secretion pathway protein J